MTVGHRPLCFLAQSSRVFIGLRSRWRVE